MRILQYRGKSLISKAIRFQTRSPHSHTAVQMDDGRVAEAWHVGGFQINPNPWTVHSAGTDIDVYGIYAHYSHDWVERWLLEQEGKGYDFRAILRFLTRRDHPDNKKLFCSEAAILAFRAGGLELLSGPAGHISPRDVALSPHLRYEETISAPHPVDSQLRGGRNERPAT